MKVIAIIPARGGSKRIPRKNLKNFLGVPILTRIIEMVINSQLFDEVMVSTDDFEIKRLAIKAGAKVPFMRSNENASDYASTYDVLEEVLLKYHENEEVFDLVFCIYPTAVLMSKERLNHAKKILQENSQTSGVMPICKFSYPIHRSLKVEGSYIRMNWPEHELTRSQDLPDAFYDAGQFYFFRRDMLLEQRKTFLQNMSYILLPENEVQDIDNSSDWEMAELKWKCKAEHKEITL